MKTIEIIGGVLAVVLLTTISYFSVITFTEIIKEEVIVYESVEIETIITKVDTVWQYKDYREDIILNDYEMLVSKNFIFNIAKDNTIGNQIRDALPFGEVFNWWRIQLGPCGIFEWNDEAYITLFKEESVNICEHE
jgi:hypothetical protein